MHGVISENPDLPDGEWQKLSRWVEQELLVTAANANIDKGPMQAQNVLESLESGEFDETLDPKQKEDLRDRASRAVVSGQTTSAGVSKERYNRSVKYISSGDASPQQVEQTLRENGDDTERLRGIRMAVIQGDARNELKTAPISQLDRRIDEIDAALQNPDLDVEEASRLRDAAEALETVRSQELEERSHDPVGGIIGDIYAADQSRSAYRAALESGDMPAARLAFSNYVGVVHQHQQLRGIPSHVRSVLTNEEADAWADQLTAEGIDADTKVATLARMQAVFGDHADLALRDVFGSNSQAAPYALAVSMQPNRQRELLVALSTDQALDSSVQKAVDTAVDGLSDLNDFAQTFAHQNSTAPRDVRGAVSTLAAYYVSRNESEGSAVEKAYTAIVGHYTVDNGTRYPSSLDSSTQTAARIGANAIMGNVHNGAKEQFVSALLESGAVQFADEGVFTDDDWRRTLSGADLQVVTNGDESGVYIAIADGGGNLLLNKVGAPVELSWKQLAEYGTALRSTQMDPRQREKGGAQGVRDRYKAASAKAIAYGELPAVLSGLAGSVIDELSGDGG
jgi:hypothetical protein